MERLHGEKRGREGLAESEALEVKRFHRGSPSRSRSQHFSGSFSPVQTEPDSGGTRHGQSRTAEYFQGGSPIPSSPSFQSWALNTPSSQGSDGGSVNPAASSPSLRFWAQGPSPRGRASGRTSSSSERTISDGREDAASGEGVDSHDAATVMARREQQPDSSRDRNPSTGARDSPKGEASELQHGNTEDHGGQGSKCPDPAPPPSGSSPSSPSRRQGMAGVATCEGCKEMEKQLASVQKALVTCSAYVQELESSKETMALAEGMTAGTDEADPPSGTPQQQPPMQQNQDVVMTGGGAHSQSFLQHNPQQLVFNGDGSHHVSLGVAPGHDCVAGGSQGPGNAFGRAVVETLSFSATQQSLEAQRQQLADLMEERYVWKAKERRLMKSLEEAEEQVRCLYKHEEALQEWLRLRACALELVSQGLILGEGMLDRGDCLLDRQQLLDMAAAAQARHEKGEGRAEAWRREAEYLRARALAAEDLKRFERALEQARAGQASQQLQIPSQPLVSPSGVPTTRSSGECLNGLAQGALGSAKQQMDLPIALALLAAKDKELQRVRQETSSKVRAQQMQGEAKAAELIEELARVQARYASMKEVLQLECESSAAEAHRLQEALAALTADAAAVHRTCAELRKENKGIRAWAEERIGELCSVNDRLRGMLHSVSAELAGASGAINPSAKQAATEGRADRVGKAQQAEEAAEQALRRERLSLQAAESAVLEAKRSILNKMHAHNRNSLAQGCVATPRHGAQGVARALSAGDLTAWLVDAGRGQSGEGSVEMREGSQPAENGNSGLEWGSAQQGVSSCESPVWGVIVRNLTVDNGVHMTAQGRKQAGVGAEGMTSRLPFPSLTCGSPVAADSGDLDSGGMNLLCLSDAESGENEVGKDGGEGEDDACHKERGKGQFGGEVEEGHGGGEDTMLDGLQQQLVEQVVVIRRSTSPLPEEVSTLKAMLRRSEDTNKSLRQQIQMLSTSYRKKGAPGERRVKGEHVQDLIERFSNL